MGRIWIALALASATSALAPQSLAAPTLPPPLSAYSALPGIEDMSLSPDGKFIAAIARVKGQREVVVTDDQHRLVTAAPVGDKKLRALRWADAKTVLVSMTATVPLGIEFTPDKVEMTGVIRVSLDGAKPEMIFAGSDAMVHAILGDYGTRTVSGRLIGYYAGVELAKSADGLDYVFEHSRPALFAVDLATMHFHKIGNAPNDGVKRDWLVDGAGRVAVTLDLHSDGGWKIISPDGGTIATGNHPGGDISLLAFGKDGTSLIYEERGTHDGVRRWFEVPLVGGQAKEILPDARIERMFVDPNNGRFLGYLPDHTAPKPVMFDPDQQHQLERVYRAFPKLYVGISEWTPDFVRFLVHTSGNGDSGSWYLVDTAAKRADPVGNDYPLIAPEAVGPISTVPYKAGDGLDIDGILTLPPGRPAHSLPAVMLPHGGPHADDVAAFDWWAQALASRGYAVFQPNFRGSTNRDDAFRNAGNGQWGRKMQTDVSDGLAELVRQGIVDPKRVCIVGASYGGYVALAGVTLQKGIYRCAVAVAGVSDMSDMYWTDYRESGDDRMLKRDMNEDYGSPAKFAEVSPRKHAKDASAPILLIHGKDDTVVAFKQSTAMLDALRDAGKPAELVVMREEDHWLSHSATRQQMLEATVAFVEKNNPAN